MATEPYELNARFEQVVVTLMAGSARFFNIIGHEIDPDALDSPLATLIAKAVLSIKQDSGRPPGSTIAVLQRLRAWNLSGNVAHDDLVAADDYFTDAEDRGLMEIETAVEMLRPHIQQAVGEAAVRDAIKAQGAGDYAELAKKFGKVERIGFVDTDVGSVFRPTNWSAVDELQFGERLGFRISELNEITSGGLVRGMAGLMAASSGGGKTSFLCDTGSGLWVQGGAIAYASIELAVGQIEMKFRAGASNVPINKMMVDPTARARCEAALVGLNLGPLVIKKFAARVTTWEMIVDWFHDVEEEIKGKPQLLVVDFLGKLGASKKGASKYESDGAIMDAMHEFAEHEHIWLWTASQPQRGKKERKVIDNDDLNDSQGKIEGSDLFLSANKREEGRELYWWVGKHRAGPSQLGCGPFPHDFAYGRICPPGWQGEDPSAATNQDDLWGSVL